MFTYIVDKVKAVTHGWKQKFLSPGGKEVLLKAVALAMPIFSMNIFRLTKEICEEINGVLANFWWGSGDKKGLHWYSWDRICTPKREGGLGFRDLEHFNQALLAKQAWRILQHPECLMARVLKARYFPHDNILTATIKRKSSYAWKSIIHGAQLLKQGMRFIIGNGEHVDLWVDPWLPEHPPRAPRPRQIGNNTQRVCDLFTTDRRNWDENRVRELIHADDVQKVLSIKICSTAQLDLLGWHYNEDGIYSVKSGYWLSTHLPQNQMALPTHGDPNLKKQIWKTKTAPKLQHFLWKILSKSLPTRENLQRRHIVQNAQCPRCCQAAETEHHILFECNYAQRVWRASGFSNLIINNPTTALEEKIKECLQCGTSTTMRHFQDLPLWILWRLWKSRNIFLFQKSEIPWGKLLRQAKTDAKEWTEIQAATNNRFGQRDGNMRPTVQQRWTKPQEGWLKCNVDGSFVNTDIPSKAGWVFRDEHGYYCGAAQATGKKVNNPLESEIQALVMAMQHSWSKGFKKIIFQSDCKKAVEIINKQLLHFDAYNWLREVIKWRQKFEEIRVEWIPRLGNKAADRLARMAIPNDSDFYYHFYVPYSITNDLHMDLLNSHQS